MKVNQWLKRVGAVALSVMMLVTMLAVCGLAIAETEVTAIYVDVKNGDDSAAGTETAPLKTIAAAFNKVNALGLTGDARKVVALGSYNDALFTLDLSGVNAYTENITLTGEAGKTLWLNNATIKLGGPTTLDLKIGRAYNEALSIRTYGYDLTLGENFEDSYYYKRTEGTIIYAGYDHSVQALTPDANGRIQLGRNNNLIINSTKNGAATIYYGNVSNVGNPVVYGDANLVLNTPNWSYGVIDLGNNGNFTNSASMWESHTRFNSLKIKVDAVTAVSSLRVNSYNGSVYAASVQAIFNNGTYSKVTTNDFLWKSSDYTKDGIVTANAFVAKSASTEAALNFTDTVGTFAVTEGYTATAGATQSVNGKLALATSGDVYDVTFAKATTTEATTTTTEEATTVTTTTTTATPAVTDAVYLDAGAGDDTNAGTEAAPLKTLKAAINKVNALGLTGDARKIIVLAAPVDSVDADLRTVDPYTENITLTCKNPGTTIWFNSWALRLGGPLTINAIIGKFVNTPMDIFTYGYDLTLGELFIDTYGGRRPEGVKINAGYDHATQALTPDANGRIQFGRNNNLTIKGTKEYTASIYFGNISQVGNPVVYGDATLIIDNPNLTVNVLDIGNNGNFTNTSSMWEPHTQFNSLKIKVDNVAALGSASGSKFMVNSYSGAVKAGSVQAIFNNGTWAKTATNNFKWSGSDYTKDGIVTANAFVMKAEAKAGSALDFTDTVGTFAVIGSEPANAGSVTSAEGKLTVAAGEYDVTFGAPTVTTTTTTTTTTTVATTTTTTVATTTTTTVATTTTTTVATTTTTEATTTTTTTTQGGGTTPSVAGGVYVDTINGDDTAAGTEDAPLKTLKAAINKVNALGLTGDARNVIFKAIDATNTAQSDLTGVDAYTENITISCANPSTTIWFDSATLKLGGPLTINAIIGKPFNEAMTIRTYGFDLTLDELFTDVYYAKRESGVEIYAGYDHAVQALTPDENKYIQFGRNNNLTIKGNKEYTVSIWFGNVTEVGNPVVYGDANILIDNPNLTIGMLDIGNNGNFANTSGMYEAHTQFKTLTIKVDNVAKIGISGGLNFRVNSYNGGVKVGTLKAIFNNGTWAKALTNNFTWATTDWTKDGFVTANAYVVKAEDFEDAELDFTDTLGTYAVTDGYTATATGNIKSVMGELIVGAGVFDVTFGESSDFDNLPTDVDVEALIKEAASKHSYHNKSTVADVKAAVSAALDAAGFEGAYTLDVKDWYLIRAVAGAKDQDGIIWEGYKGYASATIVVGGYINATVDFIGTVDPTINEYTFNGTAKQEEPFHTMTEADAENGVDTDFYMEFYPGCQITYFNDGEYFIISEDGKTLISYCGEAEKIIFPEGVERLLNAYDDDGEDWWLETTVENVRCLILPTTLKEIPDMFGRAFRSTLECVIMYDDVTVMDGWRTFMECYYLSTLRLSENLENLPQESLFQLLSLYDLRLPTGLKVIGKGAMHLSNIRDIYVPAGVEVITAEAFAWPVRKLQHLASRPQGNQVAQEVVDALYPAYKEAIWRDPNDAETYIMRSIYIITDDAEYQKDDFGTASYWNSNWAVQAVKVYYIDESSTAALLESGYTGSTDGCCTETIWEMPKPQVMIALMDAADRLQITADTTEADLLKQFNNMVYSETVTNLTLKNVVIDNDELSASGEVWGTVGNDEVLLITFDKTMMARPSVPTAAPDTTTTTTQGTVTTTTVVVTTTTVGETTTTTTTTGGQGGAETPDTGYEVPVMMILVVMATAFAAVYFLRKKAAV